MLAAIIRRGSQWRFPLGWLATIVGPFLGPEYLRRHALPPTGVVAGPLYGDALFWLPALFAWGYYVFMVFAARGWARGPRLQWRELVEFLCVRHGRLTTVVLVGCSLVMIYGLSSYWYADMDEIVIHKGWGTRIRIYSWSSVVKQLITCHKTRGSVVTTYRLQMSDGQWVDLNSDRASDFYRRFTTLLMLARSGSMEFGDIRTCPEFVRDAL